MVQTVSIFETAAPTVHVAMIQYMHDFFGLSYVSEMLSIF